MMRFSLTFMINLTITLKRFCHFLPQLKIFDLKAILVHKLTVLTRKLVFYSVSCGLRQKCSKTIWNNEANDRLCLTTNIGHPKF